MPLIRRAVVGTTSTLFGGAPSQTNAPTQGSVTFYQDGACLEPLSNMPTPLILGECQNAPIPPGILAVSINSLPTCENYGTPILVVSDQPNCNNSTVGTEADSGQLDKCQAYSSGADIGSVEFICYGSGIAPVSPTTTSTSNDPYSSTNPPTTTTTVENEPPPQSYSSSSDDSCCCCCVVM
ncbi:hypothetical protein H2200_002085 [Cladophialophora chaetospira]|uniref:Uncharacterized protein n=1 Tax=Cladophialophora chaetospira TaxID=386627 RepID=A0AA38XIB8_9EURO|nr:hypothetical protein H2200_002085 [Cladophialophora chaetospira]